MHIYKKCLTPTIELAQKKMKTVISYTGTTLLKVGYCIENCLLLRLWLSLIFVFLFDIMQAYRPFTSSRGHPFRFAFQPRLGLYMASNLPTLLLGQCTGSGKTLCRAFARNVKNPLESGSKLSFSVKGCYYSTGFVPPAE